MNVRISIGLIVNANWIGSNDGITGSVVDPCPVTLYVIFGAVAKGWLPESVISVQEESWSFERAKSALSETDAGVALVESSVTS